jgi:hypothetical protein
MLEVEGKEVILQPVTNITGHWHVDLHEHFFDEMRQVVRIALVIHENASMGVEGFGSVWKHPRTLGGQWIEGIGLRRRFTLPGRQAPVKATKGDPDAPGKESRLDVGGGLLVCILLVVITFCDDGLSHGTSRFGHRSSVGLIEAVEVEADVVDLLLDTGKFGFDGGGVIRTQAGTQESGEKEGVRGLVDCVEGTLERPGTTGESGAT